MDDHVVELITESSNLLLEDETHSTHYHGHTAEHAPAQKSHVALFLRPISFSFIIIESVIY